MTVSRETTTFEMIGLSAATPMQSEAYISTVVLYQLYGGIITSGGKGYVRLQGTWKDIWTEFVEKDKQLSEKQDMEELLRMKRLVLSDAQKDTAEPTQVDSEMKKRMGDNSGWQVISDVQEGGNADPLPDWEKRVEGETLREEWEMRCISSPYLNMLVRNSGIISGRLHGLVVIYALHQRTIAGTFQCGLLKTKYSMPLTRSR